jgi:hypothetical protein
MGLRGGEQRIIFVLGSGRSGTHWLGHILSGHPDIRVTNEHRWVFPRVTRMAIDASAEDQLFPRVARFYRWQTWRARPSHYADKSHPNLWLAERLAAEFGDVARFVAIERSPFAVAASSLRHHGVSSWNTNWQRHPIPNRFLGIDEQLAGRCKSLTNVEKFAYRWLAHHRETEPLRPVLGSRLHVVSTNMLRTMWLGRPRCCGTS